MSHIVLDTPQRGPRRAKIAPPRKATRPLHSIAKARRQQTVDAPNHYRHSARSSAAQDGGPGIDGLDDADPGPWDRRLQHDSFRTDANADVGRLNNVLRKASFAALSLCYSAEQEGRSVDTLSDEEILHAITKPFGDRNPGPVGTDDPGAEAKTTVGQPSSIPATPAPVGSGNRGIKRRRRSEEEDQSDQGKQARPRPDISGRAGVKDGWTWACPFYLFNRVAHQDCLLRKMKRIGDVRTHIKRNHRQARHCPICKQLFRSATNDSDYIAHIRAQNCRENNANEIPGATADQIDQMGECAKEASTRTPEARWYVIWAVMFPGQDEPPRETIKIFESEFKQILADSIKSFWESNTGRSVANEIIGFPLHEWGHVTEASMVNVMTVLNRFVQHVENRESDRQNSLQVASSGLNSPEFSRTTSSNVSRFATSLNNSHIFSDINSSSLSTPLESYTSFSFGSNWSPPAAAPASSSLRTRQASQAPHANTSPGGRAVPHRLGQFPLNNGNYTTDRTPGHPTEDTPPSGFQP